VTGADKLSEVEREEEEYDSIAHLDAIAADGGFPLAPYIKPTIFSPSLQGNEAKGSWQLEKIQEVPSEGLTSPATAIYRQHP
jgi:hypothetical protein